MNRARILTNVLVLSGLLLPLPAVGQSQAFAEVPIGTALESSTLLPTLRSPDLMLATGAPQESVYELAEPALLQPQARARNRRGIPLMVAGGALFVAGAIIGDDAGTILMLGGAGVGAWGLYVYFGG